MTTQNIVIVIGCVLVLYSMFRLIYINHSSPHRVDITRWMFSGGIIELVKGLIKGTMDLFRLHLDDNSICTLGLYLGIFLIALAL